MFFFEVLGHCELIICPIDSNGDSLKSLIVYSASQNTCRASPHALNYSKNMDKGKNSEKTYLHLLIFQPGEVTYWFPIFSSPEPKAHGELILY